MAKNKRYDQSERIDGFDDDDPGGADIEDLPPQDDVNCGVRRDAAVIAAREAGLEPGWVIPRQMLVDAGFTDDELQREVHL